MHLYFHGVIGVQLLAEKANKQSVSKPGASKVITIVQTRQCALTWPKFEETILRIKA